MIMLNLYSEDPEDYEDNIDHTESEDEIYNN